MVRLNLIEEITKEEVEVGQEMIREEADITKVTKKKTSIEKDNLQVKVHHLRHQVIHRPLLTMKAISRINQVT